jgi:CRISPR/Cas system CSM-associated protein Csm3 (group 7 of RAMP superfamily)
MTILALARVTIELVTPLTVASGDSDLFADSVCVSDANDLPTLPGSSLAGVLRSGLRSKQRANSLFGYQSGDRGARSRVEVSWGQVHDAVNRPISARPRPDAGLDPVVAFIRNGIVRDHVRLTDKGAAERHKKFDERLVPAGTRFTFEVTVFQDPLDGAVPAKQELFDILEILGRPETRIGAKGRRGLGAFALVSEQVCWGQFNLSDPSDRAKWLLLPRDLALPVPEGVLSSYVCNGSTAIAYEVNLKAEDFWSFGGGAAVLPEHLLDEKETDSVPVCERRIEWNQRQEGSVGDWKILVPGSSIKGALRHRATFHYRRQQMQGPAAEIKNPEFPDPLRALFGELKGGSEEREDREENSGTAGALFLDDCYVDRDKVKWGALMHVSLDRFTQGPVAGRLFSESLCFGGEFSLRLALDGRRFDDNIRALALTAHDRSGALRALKSALDDLGCGRLGLGGGDAKGHGYFRGTVLRDELQVEEAR